ncbi:MAG: NAD(P)/FAD-dependent oxidoreductase [Acidobacteriota bacterium]
MKQENQFDVAILGGGFSGSMLATILGKEGARVLVVDGQTHPRFAIGEATVRHSLRMVKLIAERYDIPELRKISSGDNIRKYVTSACGEKRNFGFIYHHEGQAHQNPREATQLVIPPFREGYEAHLFRQDIDAFLFNSAIHYGAVTRQGVYLDDVNFDPDRVQLTLANGETFTADYVVDATGFRSPLAQKFGLREEPTRARTHSRVLFTHMIDVTPYDDCVNNIHGTPERWYNGTCHHIFDGGWVWVIPFNNHPESTNDLVSVGLQLDPRKHPKPDDMTPQQEWEAFLERFPSIAVQFKNARAVRPWVSTGRVQYSSRQTVGDRWCLLGHAGGFIDAIFSRGLAITMEALGALAPLLLKAIKDGDFSAQRFQYLERLQANLVTNTDLVAYGAYVSYCDFDLWNAWFRVWALGVGIGDLRLAAIYRTYLKTHDDSILPDNAEPMGLLCCHHQGFLKLFQSAIANIEEVEKGFLDPKEASRRIFALIREADFTSPAVGLADPSRRYINAGTLGTLLRSALWAVTSAPPEMKSYILNVSGWRRQLPA